MRNLLIYRFYLRRFGMKTKSIRSFVITIFMFCSSVATVFGEHVKLIGAGATFPYPLYVKMFKVYYQQYGIKINYQAIGSGGGIRQIRNKTVDFGASDAFLSDEELKKFDSPVVHIPICSGAVVISYNLPVKYDLKLTPKLLSDIFLGRITKWNDAHIKSINKGISLPDMNIAVVHRSDGSGTTFIFSDYMSKVSSEWKKKVGRGKSLNWPCGLGAKGNAGVAGLIKQVPGSIGYVELTYALQNHMPTSVLQNKSGNFIKPTVQSVSKASDIPLPDDMRISLTNTSAKEGYPISGFTYILVYKDLKDGKLGKEKSRTLVRLLWWMTHDGQKFALPFHYAPLSNPARSKTSLILNSLMYDGKRVGSD